MPILVEIQGQLYELRYSLKTMKRLQQDHKIAFLRGGDQMVAALQDPERLAVLLWYGLTEKHPDLTLDWVETSIDAGTIMRIVPQVVHAMTGRWQDPDQLPNAPAPSSPQSTPTGSPSGPSGDTISNSLTPTSGR